MTQQTQVFVESYRATYQQAHTAFRHKGTLTVTYTCVGAPRT